MTGGRWVVACGTSLALGCSTPAGSDAVETGATTSGVSDGTDEGETGLLDDGGAGIGPPCDTVPVVHFVYFVEADQTFDGATLGHLEAFAYHFQNYWYGQLGGTFYLNDPVVDLIMGERDAQWYVETPDEIHDDERWYRLGNIMTEVYGILDIDWFDPTHRVLNYPVARYDGRVGANFGGGWMDGDDLACMTGVNGGVTWPYEGGVDAHCVGHPAHEFGHVLGLEHQGPPTDCMQYGFYNNSGGAGMCSFSIDNVAQILDTSDNGGWLDAMPGDRCAAR